MRELIRDVNRFGRFTPPASYQRLPYVCAAALVASGLVHLGVFAVDGGSWAGPVSWRKPVVFGLSFGIALATVTWLMRFLRPRSWAAWILLGVFSAAALGEVLLISMQRWRGVPSHFNESTPFDSTVFSVMGMLVTLVAGVLVVITVWSFFRFDAPPSLALAARFGLVMMLVSQWVGVQMIAQGGNTFGDDGLLKIPHAVTLHAVQVLPALALLLLVTPTRESHRLRVVSLGALGYTSLAGSTIVQTFTGRGPFELTMTATALAVVGLGLLAASAGVAVWGVATRSRPRAPTPPGLAA